MTPRRGVGVSADATPAVPYLAGLAPPMPDPDLAAENRRLVAQVRRLEEDLARPE